MVSHDSGLLNDCCTYILQIANLKLNNFKGNLDDFVKSHPEARSYFSFKESKLKFKFPQVRNCEDTSDVCVCDNTLSGKNTEKIYSFYLSNPLHFTARKHRGSQVQGKGPHEDLQVYLHLPHQQEGLRSPRKRHPHPLRRKKDPYVVNVNTIHSI